jgi:long-chain acyl-CoA synthetase
MIKENLIVYFADAIRQNWDLPSLSDFQGAASTFGEVGIQVKKIHELFEKAGIKKGDKISLVGKNSTNWTVSFIATLSYGAVIVPILPDFTGADIRNIVDHSNSVLVFASDQAFSDLSEAMPQQVIAVIGLNDFSTLYKKPESQILSPTEMEDALAMRYPQGLNAANFTLENIPNDTLSVINYTSGTTGFSKGVMLLLNSLSANVRYARENMPLKSGDKIVSFLPLAHTYGCAFEFLFPFSLGCHITFLTKSPSPNVILQAFGEIKPHLVLSVPLVIEKIYKKQILPAISKPMVKVILHIPLLNKLIYNKIRKSLINAFGERFHEIVIGGAALNSEVEKFLSKINFPFAIGYGMTECAPLISYASWQKRKLGSAGKLIDTLEIAIDSDNPYKTTGEILLRGENVMVGYYRNELATRDALDSDGWLHTGDLGLIDKENFIYIKGRSKCMILGPSGQNIYPEEIEAHLNNMLYVLESIVVQRNGKLVALVVPDMNQIEQDHLGTPNVPGLMEEYRKAINAELPNYMGITKMEIYENEFEKTPKRSIKRFLYE